MIDTKSNTDSPFLIEDRKPVILLSVRNTNDRRLIEKYLSDHFIVDVSDNGITDNDFDLCIIDEYSFDKNRERLKQRKEKSLPLFLPFLLLSQNQNIVRKNAIVLEFADDVVYIPVSTKLLQSRINLLLKQREYSLKLEEKNRQLAQKNEKLAKEKRKYELLTENSTDMISRHKPDGTYLYASPASEELTGYQPEELIGRNAYESMHPEDREKILDENTPFPDKPVIRMTFRKKTKSGEYKWVETNMRLIRDDKTGEIVELQASTRDISARKEFERRLKEEKEFIDKSIESLPELFFLIDEDQNFVKWNNIEQELGYSDEEVQQMHPLQFYHEKDHAFITSKIHKAFVEGSAEAEVEMQTKNGDLVPYFVTAKEFERGDKHFLVGSCINLSDIKKAQYELEQHRQLLDAIINQTEAVIYVKDKEGKLRLVNDSYLELFGLTREEVIGKTDREVFGSKLADNVEYADREVFDNGKTLEVEEEIPLEDETRYYHSIKYPLKGVPGFENCMCGISTDITDLKRASRKLKERVKELRCLYNVSSLGEYKSSIDELLQDAVEYIPEGFQYPQIAEASIGFEGKTYTTKYYKDHPDGITSKDRKVNNNHLHIKVIYSKGNIAFEADEFLEEEQKLIDNIANTLSSKINRILAQERLKESRRRWESLVQNDPDLIQILLPDGTIKFINPSGASILGYDCPDEVMGKNYFEIMEVSEEAFELTKNRVQKVLEDIEIESHTYKVTNAKGRELYLESKAVPITLDDGQKGLQQVAEDVTDRVKYERQLEESLKEKETLLQEIHHRVKNNLAVVSGMMELQTFSTENKEVKSLLADSKNRIKTMALIHEKLYQSKSLSEIDFGTYVKDLLENIQEVSILSNAVDVELEYDMFSLNVNQAVPCALIINEVASNAFEHAFSNQENGTVAVSLEERAGKIKVIISDDGKGIPDNLDDKESDSLGFAIIETLLTQLEAEKEINNDNGFTFSFTFDKQELKGSVSNIIE